MKKSAFYFLAILILSCGLAACGPTEATPIQSPGVADTPASASATIALPPTASATASASPGGVPMAGTSASAPSAPASADSPNDDEAWKNAEAMLPILDSLIRAADRDAPVYAPGDPDFFWSTLYLMGVNWGEAHPLVELNDEYEMVVPRQVMREFASAAFLEYDDLLPIPEELAQSVWYDDALDAYRLAPSDMGDTATRLAEVKPGKDGAATAFVELFAWPDEKLGMYEFTLAPNPYADAIAEPIYRYSVSAFAAVE